MGMTESSVSHLIGNGRRINYSKINLFLHRWRMHLNNLLLYSCPEAPSILCYDYQYFSALYKTLIKWEKKWTSNWKFLTSLWFLCSRKVFNSYRGCISYQLAFVSWNSMGLGAKWLVQHIWESTDKSNVLTKTPILQWDGDRELIKKLVKRKVPISRARNTSCAA